MEAEQPSDVKKIFSILDESQTVLVSTHENPDGDALASVCLMYDALTKDGKNVHVFCKDIPEEDFDFLPHIERVTADKNSIPWRDITAVVVVDCAHLQRTGLADEISRLACPVINIDHHLSNRNFGTVNVVDDAAVATTEILYELYQSDGRDITKNMATCILTGILTDSGNFAYAATNAQTFDIASEMLRRGANVRDILHYTHKNKSLPTLKIWGLALSRLQYNQTYDIASTVLTQDDLAVYGATKEDLEGLSNFLNTLKDATIVMVLYELPDGRVKGSFRTTREGVDVSRLAEVLGGGGHAKAAGFELTGRLVRDGDGWKVE